MTKSKKSLVAGAALAGTQSRPTIKPIQMHWGDVLASGRL